MKIHKEKNEKDVGMNVCQILLGERDQMGLSFFFMRAMWFLYTF